MKMVAVTGATSGIGFAVCQKLVSRGYGIIGIGRNIENCEKAVEALKKECSEIPVRFFCGDLMKQSEVYRVGADVRDYVDAECEGQLYALINNAGCARGYYTTTEDGYEQQFALNHLAGFLLTHLLLPCLIKGKGRVLMTSSGSHKRMKMNWNDIMFQKGYHPLLVYKQSKLCNMLFAYGLNERFASQGITAYGIDPGLVKTDIGLKQTGGLVSYVWKIRRKGGVLPEVPAKTYAYLCDEPEAPHGLYYYLCREEPYSKEVNKQNADKLWTLSEQLCGIKFGKDDRI